MLRLQFLVSTLTTLCVASVGRAAGGVAAAAASSPLAQRLVASFDRAFQGPHAGYRANHAKGIVCVGRFEPAPGAAALSRAAHFARPVRATVRFSDFGGVPSVPDGDDAASPHGMAVKFHLPEGAETDLVGHSVPLFPSATPQEFNDFLQALGSPPAAMQRYLSTHAAAAAFVRYPKPPPPSFAALSYSFIDAFYLVAANGTKRAVRYRMKTQQPAAPLRPVAARRTSRDYLARELRNRLRRGPVEFTYLAQLASDADPTHDPTHLWPQNRAEVTLGRLTITGVVADTDAAQRSLLFDPARLIDGIALTDDPLVPARSAAYAISYARRLAAASPAGAAS